MPSPPSLSPAPPEGQGALQEGQERGCGHLPQGWNAPELPFSIGFWGHCGDKGSPAMPGSCKDLRGAAPMGILALHAHILLREPPRNVSDQGQIVTWTDKMNFSGPKKKKWKGFIINPRSAVPHPAGTKLGKLQITCFAWQRVFSAPWSDAELSKSLHTNTEGGLIPPLEALLVLSSGFLHRLL